MIERLRLVEQPGGQGPGARAAYIATGVCPMTEAAVEFFSDAYEGLLLRAVYRFPQAGPCEPGPPWRQSGAAAWLIESGQRVSGRLPRRLQRHGWRVNRFGAVAEALAEAAAMAVRGDAAWPALLILVETPDLDAAQAVALRQAMPATTHAVLAVIAGSPLWAAPPPALRYDTHLLPFSPADLAGLAGAVDGAGTAPGPVPPAGAALATSRTLVLLVDDNEVNRIVGRGLVEALGYEVETANDGLDAIDHCRHSPPHIVLMDLQMPILDGFEATRRLRELQRLGEVSPFAILAATADASELARKACLIAGMDGYLSKPLNLGELQAQLRRFTLPR